RRRLGVMRMGTNLLWLRSRTTKSTPRIPIWADDEGWSSPMRLACSWRTVFLLHGRAFNHGQCRSGHRRNEQKTGGIDPWTADECRNQGFYAAQAHHLCLSAIQWHGDGVV